MTKRACIRILALLAGSIVQSLFISPVSAAVTYYSTGNFTSTNLLSGHTASSIDSFHYNISALPAGSSVTAQFSIDNATWYAADGTLGGSTTLSTTGGADLDLSALGWSGSDFYYKITLNAAAGGSDTPAVDDIRLDYTDAAPTAHSLVFDSSGKLGIGTTSPDTTLKVIGSICASATDVTCFGSTAGNIYASNFIVNGTTHLPDYVFESDYPLMGLDDLQNYIDINKHLPGVASATDVAENGLNLSQMVPSILEKTEENTLYILQNHKAIQGLTDNQNLIAEQLTDKLADQTLSISDKIDIIGRNLDSLKQKEADIKDLQEQFDALTQETRSIASLQEAMKDLNPSNLALLNNINTDTLISLTASLNTNLMIYKDAIGNVDLGTGNLMAQEVRAQSAVFTGEITASDIDLTGNLTAKDITASGTVAGAAIEMSSETSGKGTIGAGLVLVEIPTPEASTDVKIYLTPTSKLSGRSLWIDPAKIKAGQSFTVEIDGDVPQDNIEFNWLIVK